MWEVYSLIKMTDSIKRVIRAGWQGFSRDGGIVAANILIMVIAVSVISSLFLFNGVSKFMTSELQGKIDIAVYFNEETNTDDIFEIQDELAENPQVKEVIYVSKEEALVEFVERHKDDPVLLESVEEVGRNPFLASLSIRSFNASQYEAVAGFLESARFDEIIKKVDYYERKPVIERIFSLTSNLNMLGIIISLVLIIIAVLVAFNNIRLAIYNSREEIKIQRLVGASNWFIRGPFLVQGVVSGLFASLISLLLFIALSLALTPVFKGFFPGLSLFSFFLDNFFIIFLIQVVAGIGLGAVSSFIAIRRYLEV